MAPVLISLMLEVMEVAGIQVDGLVRELDAVTRSRRRQSTLAGDKSGNDDSDSGAELDLPYSGQNKN